MLSARDLLTKEYDEANFAYKVILLIAAVHLKAISCYIGFTAMEANFIACGQSYKPAQDNGRVPEDFFAIKQVHIWVFETREGGWSNCVASWNV